MDRIEGLASWGGPAPSIPAGNAAARRLPKAPGELAGPAWDSLMRLAADLGDGDVASGLLSVVGVARNVVAGSALETSLPWIRTLAASQATGMSDAEVLDAFRIDGSQFPRLLELRAAFAPGNRGRLEPGIDPEEVIEAEWLLRMMGIPSDLAGQAITHLRRQD